MSYGKWRSRLDQLSRPIDLWTRQPTYWPQEGISTDQSCNIQGQRKGIGMMYEVTDSSPQKEQTSISMPELSDEDTEEKRPKQEIKTNKKL